MRVKEKGFTLIELIIVIVIIGILAAIAAPMMSGNVQKAKRSEAVTILGALRTAQRLYYVDNDRYTTAMSDLSVYINTPDMNGRYVNSIAFSVATANFVNFNGLSVDGQIGAMNMSVQNGMLYGY